MSFVYWLVAVVAIIGPIMAANRAYKKGLEDGQKTFILRSMIIRRYGIQNQKIDDET